MYALLANPNKHFYETRKKPVSIIVLHVTAGLEDLDLQGVDHSAEKTNEYGATTTREASWHKCVDSDSIADALPDSYTAFHVKDYNSGSLGLEISNKDARWDNKPSIWTNRTLLNAAKVCLAWEREFDIPRRLLTKTEVDSGKKGYTYHMFLDPARRSDPGKTFPWEKFGNVLRALDMSSNATESGDFVMDGTTRNQMRTLLQEELRTALGNANSDTDADPTHDSLADIRRDLREVLERLLTLENVVSSIAQYETPAETPQEDVPTE